MNLKPYGLTKEEYNRLCEAAKGRCSICHREQPLCVEHDHETGEIRGLVCNRCNALLRSLESRRKLINSAIRYLRDPPARQVFGLPKIPFKHFL